MESAKDEKHLVPTQTIPNCIPPLKWALEVPISTSWVPRQSGPANWIMASFPFWYLLNISLNQVPLIQREATLNIDLTIPLYSIRKVQSTYIAATMISTPNQGTTLDIVTWTLFPITFIACCIRFRADGRNLRLHTYLFYLTLVSTSDSPSPFHGKGALTFSLSS